MTLELCYHPYYSCLYAFWYSIPTFFSIFCNCFLYMYLFLPLAFFCIASYNVMCIVCLYNYWRLAYLIYK